MSRTRSSTPTRRSRRLLNNGYYYSSDVENLLLNDLAGADSDESGSINLDASVSFDPKRNFKYSKSSPLRRRRNLALRNRLNNSNIPKDNYVRYTKEVTRTYSQTGGRLNHSRTTQSSTTQISATNDDSSRYGHQVNHMYGLEYNNDIDHRIHPDGNVFGAGEPSNPQWKSMSSSHQVMITPTNNNHQQANAAPTASHEGNSSINRRTSGMSVYSDSEEYNSSSELKSKSTSKRKSSSSTLSRNLFDSTKKMMKKPHHQQGNERGNVFATFTDFISLIVSGVLHQGNLLYQTVAYALVLDTWFLKAKNQQVSMGEGEQPPTPSILFNIFRAISKLVSYVLSLLIVALAVFTCFICLAHYQPHWLGTDQRKPQVVKSTKFAQGIADFLHERMKFFYGEYENDEKSPTSSAVPLFQETPEYRILLETVHNLETSFGLLKESIEDRDMKSDKMSKTFSNNHVDTIHRIQDVKRQVEENEASDAKFKEKIERQQRTVDQLNEKISQLQNQLNSAHSSSTSMLDALNEQNQLESSKLVEEQNKARTEVRTLRLELDELKSKLQIVELKANEPRKEVEPFDWQHLELVIEKYFVSSLMLLLRNLQLSDQQRDADKYSELSTMLSVWLDTKGYLTKEEFQVYASHNITAEIRNEIALCMQQIEAKMPRGGGHKPPTSSSEGGSADHSIPSNFNVEVLTRKILESGYVKEADVKKWIHEALQIYSADRLGLADFALESAGGYVVNTRCTKGYTRQRAVVKVLGIPLYYNTNTPRTAIQPSTMPGECWAFEGHVGYLVVGLSVPVYPSSVSIDHVPHSIALLNISSAPKDFTIHGLDSANDVEGVELGRFRFEYDGSSVQNFVIDNNSPLDGSSKPRRPFSFIELRVTSNWGNPLFTCLYRFRVHGTSG